MTHDFDTKFNRLKIKLLIFHLKTGEWYEKEFNSVQYRFQDFDFLFLNKKSILDSHNLMFIFMFFGNKKQPTIAN